MALLAALALYLTLPPTLHPRLRLVVAAVELLALVPLLVLNPVRLRQETRLTKAIGSGQAILLAGATLFALAELAAQLIVLPADDGPRLLLAALQVWLAVVIAFSLLYWEFDRGGAVRRRHIDLRRPRTIDFRFPQDDGPQDALLGALPVTWYPSYVDYLVLSLTNATAFAPGRSVPLTTRAKLVLAVQSFAGFALIGVVVVRAVVLVV
ncbi:hypothetical protein AS850_11805 [Frondihabitans sp. 762G35]|nr:hypothetical protein AS850_11805 [Frondihabitans sp. 762G35]